jgi:Transposase DDE domain
MSSTFDLHACARLPLAEAAFRLLDYTLAADFLVSVFEQHRGRSYEKTISFPLFVHLISEALLDHSRSVHQTFQRAQQDDSLKTSIQAAYGKLRRVPLELSVGMFADATTRLHTIGSPVVANRLPASLDEFRVLAFDGKKLKYVVKRLKPLRGLKGNIFGGKLLVVQELSTQQAIAVEAVADGESADNPLVPPVVARVRAMPISGPRLWVGDRAFCDFKLLGLLTADADQFVVRFSTGCGFHPDSTEPVRTGTDDVNRPFREEWGWLGKPENPHRIRVRKITIVRDTVDPLIFVTSLLDADRYPAKDLLTMYRSRWGIEVMFQRVVQTFDLRHLIGGTPQATVFQAVFCLLLYNITMIIRDYVAAGAKREPKTVSLDLLFDDLIRELTAWSKMISTDGTYDLLHATRVHTPQDLRRHIQKILGTIWTDCWNKSPTRKRPPKGVPRAYICGGHTSVDKILKGKHKEIPIEPRKKKNEPSPLKVTKDV